MKFRNDKILEESIKDLNAIKHFIIHYKNKNVCECQICKGLHIQKLDKWIADKQNQINQTQCNKQHFNNTGKIK